MPPARQWLQSWPAGNVATRTPVGKSPPALMLVMPYSTDYFEAIISTQRMSAKGRLPALANDG